MARFALRAGGRLFELVGLFELAGSEREIAFVASGVEPSVGDGVFNGARGLDVMRAVGEFTQIFVRPEIAVISEHLFRLDVPEHELADAGRVDDVAAERELEEPRGRRRVPAFLIFAAHFPDAELERGVDRVERGRFPDARLTDDDALAPDENAPEPIEIKARLGAEENRPIAHARVDADERLEGRGVDKIDFVNADNRLNAGPLARYEYAVDEIRLHSRLGGARNYERLLDVRDDDVLALPARSAEGAAARFDAFDDPLFAAVGEHGVAEIDAVARDDDLALVRGERLEHAARYARIDVALFVFDVAVLAVDAQHAPFAADVEIDVGKHGKVAAFAGEIFEPDVRADDRPFARDVPFCGDAFAERDVVDFAAASDARVAPWLSGPLFGLGVFVRFGGVGLGLFARRVFGLFVPILGPRPALFETPGPVDFARSPGAVALERNANLL